MEKVCFLRKNKLRFKRKKHITVQNNNVNKCIFHFLGTRIWVPMSVYRYENPSGCIIDLYTKSLYALYISITHAKVRFGQLHHFDMGKFAAYSGL